MRRPADGDVALVTGAGNGLGASIARALHGSGYRVVIGDIDRTAAESVAHALDTTGTTTLALHLDVRDKDAIAGALRRASEQFGSVEALVNNAAMTAVRSLFEISPEEFDASIAVNLRGTFVASQVFGSYFAERKYGRILNIASLAGQNGGTATGAHYAASKGGIITLTKVFARDLAPFGVTANAIAPGPLETPAVREKITPDKMDEFLTRIPVGKLGDPAFVGDIAARLCARDAGFVTGATWDMNGGIYMR